jgi:hypothetical protein
MMKVKDSIALHLRCIEADLREYLMDPSDHTFETIEDVHILLLDVMYRLGITPISEEENIDIDLDGGLSATNEQGESE